MRVTQTAEYALRVLAHMATLGETRPVRAKDLSKETGIPLHYLSKILRRLVSRGLLRSQKGHGGGFVFARPLHQIRFSDIFDAVDYEIEPSRCVFGWDECGEANPCPLHGFWKQVKEHFADWARQYTLEDVKNNVIQIG